MAAEALYRLMDRKTQERAQERQNEHDFAIAKFTSDLANKAAAEREKAAAERQAQMQTPEGRYSSIKKLADEQGVPLEKLTNDALSHMSDTFKQVLKLKSEAQLNAHDELVQRLAAGEAYAKAYADVAASQISASAARAATMSSNLDDKYLTIVQTMFDKSKQEMETQRTLWSNVYTAGAGKAAPEVVRLLNDWYQKTPGVDIWKGSENAPPSTITGMEGTQPLKMLVVGDKVKSSSVIDKYLSPEKFRELMRTSLAGATDSRTSELTAAYVEAMTFGNGSVAERQPDGKTVPVPFNQWLQKRNLQLDSDQFQGVYALLSGMIDETMTARDTVSPDGTKSTLAGSDPKFRADLASVNSRGASLSEAAIPAYNELLSMLNTARTKLSGIPTDAELRYATAKVLNDYVFEAARKYPDASRKEIQRLAQSAGLLNGIVGHIAFVTKMQLDNPNFVDKSPVIQQNINALVEKGIPLNTVQNIVQIGVEKGATAALGAVGEWEEGQYAELGSKLPGIAEVRADISQRQATEQRIEGYARRVSSWMQEGNPLPSEDELVEEFGLSWDDAAKTMQRLQAAANIEERQIQGISTSPQIETPLGTQPTTQPTTQPVAPDDTKNQVARSIGLDPEARRQASIELVQEHNKNTVPFEFTNPAVTASLKETLATVEKYPEVTPDTFYNVFQFPEDQARQIAQQNAPLAAQISGEPQRSSMASGLLRSHAPPQMPTFEPYKPSPAPKLAATQKPTQPSGQPDGQSPSVTISWNPKQQQGPEQRPMTNNAGMPLAASALG